MRPTRRSAALVTLAALAAMLGLAGERSSAAPDPCVRMPTSGAPLWIDYGEGSVPAAVRAVFGRPGVTVAASGTAIPAQYRASGARTTYFVLKLPAYVGSPTAPADPSTVAAAADRLYGAAVASTQCPSPIVALNELAAPAAPVPWSDGVRTYRADVLALMQRLAERGAVPVLLVHGSPGFAGEAVPWWQAVGAAGHVVYQAYYKAPNIVRLGRIVGPRRIRLGMRSIVRSLTTVGVPRNRIGLMLGFQVAPGKGGREGLQPSADWFRYVKWNALAAKQVAQEARLASIWSWGWGTLSAAAGDPDKPAAACVYLWARDQRLCDGRAAAGPGFKWSLVEGTIAIPPAYQCLSVVGKLPRSTVAAHTALTHDLATALDATFTREVLRKRIPISSTEVDAAEAAVIARSFGGSRDAYLAELARRGATPIVARGILEDALRRDRIAALGLSQTPLSWVADAVTAAIDTATCRSDQLPGYGEFPLTDRRETAGAPIAALLPFLLDDAVPPAAPLGATVTLTGGAAQLSWTDGTEPDLLGYVVYRAPASGMPFVQLNQRPWPRPSWVDRRSVSGAVYEVRAVDASGNLSDPAPVSVVG